jgi:glycosyltransferase involved in cell wall biosynthesis
MPSSVFVIPNAVVSDQFKPASEIVPLKPRTLRCSLTRKPLLKLYFEVNIIVISRLAYRKGVDLLVATAPKVCEQFPDVRFIIGKSTVWRCSMKCCKRPAAAGDGPKLTELLQMREKYMLQDRVTLLGSVRHEDVRSVSACSNLRRAFHDSLPKIWVNAHVGPHSGINFLEYFTDGSVRSRYCRGCLRRVVCREHSSGWRP